LHGQILPQAPRLVFPSGGAIPSAIRYRALPLFALPHYDGGVSFSETIFLFVLALIVFGPKKLPEIARQAGKLLAELRRASNEFRSQIDAEIAHLEVQKSAEKYQSVLPPAPPPPGAVASLSQNPSQPVTHQLEAATLAVPSPESSSSGASVDVAPAAAASSAADVAEPVVVSPPETAPADDLKPATAPQDSHV
jgi:sec-independent protein translocase protein TatB